MLYEEKQVGALTKRMGQVILRGNLNLPRYNNTEMVLNRGRSSMQDNGKIPAKLSQEKSFELCDQIRRRRPYPWRLLSLGGCWTCFRFGRVCLRDPMGCTLVNERYERMK